MLTLRGDAGSVTVKAMVVADETTPLEVKIFAGWILVDAPVEVNLLLNGREKIGSSMDGQILLPPGTHRRARGQRGARHPPVADGQCRARRRRARDVRGAARHAHVAGRGGGVPRRRLGGNDAGSIKIPPGTHEIVLRLADGTERRQAMTVRAGQRVEF